MVRLAAVFVVGVALLCASVPAIGGEIHRAIEAGDAALVEQIVKKDPSAVSQRDESQFRELPIQVAAAT